MPSQIVNSIFSGIGGFEVGFARAGLTTALMCERDASAQAVLRQRFPDTDLVDDRYLLSRATKLQEILDYRRVPSEQVRRLLVEQGIDRLAPGTTSVVAALEDGRCVALDMIRHPVSGRFVAAMTGLHGLAAHVFDATVMESDQIEGRVFAIPGVTVGEQVGRLDWSPDSDFLDTLVKRLRRIASSPDPFPFTRAQTDSLITYLSRAALLPAVGDDLARLKARLATFVGDLKVNTRELDDLIAILCDLKGVNGRLAEEVASRRAELESQLRSELSVSVEREVRTAFQAVDEERSKLMAEAAELSDAISEHRKAVANLEMAQSELATQLRHELASLQGSLHELPDAVHDQVVELSRRVGERLDHLVQGVELIPARAPPWARVVSPLASLETWEKGARHLRNAAKRWGFHFEDLVCADIAARAGRIVLLPRKIAADFCSCYAASISAGHFLRHVLDPSILSLDDLWRQPPAFAPTGLARAWAFATTHPRRYVPVLLDGLERTSLDLWLPSLVEEISSIRRPTNLLIFASLGEKIIDRARVPEDFGDLVVPVLPESNGEISAAMIAKAGGPAPLSSALDCATASRPTRGQMLELLEEMELPATKDPTEILCWISAAWALRDTINPSTAARAFVDSMSTRAGAPEHLVALRRGRDWLSDLSLAG
jgi:C-5 cytosine-specific DNA methylase